MAKDFDAETLAEYDNLRTILDSLHTCIGAICEQARRAATDEAFCHDDLDEFGDRRNDVAPMIERLRDDLTHRVYQAVETIARERSRSLYAGLKPCPPGEYGA